VKASLKYRIIENCADHYPVQQMCKFFEVSRSGYYQYLKRKELPDRDLALAEQIAECQRERGKIHGYRYVQLWLEKKVGIYRNPKTILRIMVKYGLLSEVRRKRWQSCGQGMHRYANLLNGEFGADKPNQKWVTDISYIPTDQGTLYLSIIRDLFDNSIVAYKTSTRQTVSLVLDTLNAAMQKEKVAGGLTLHSDQGFQYTSEAYFRLIKEYDISPSMSRRANPYDNSLAENFFSILKTECIHRQKLQSFDHARILIDDYIFYYNFERFQLKCRLTPFEKRCQSA